MKKNFLDQEGVNDYLKNLYASSVRVQMNEQKMIRLCLCTWAPYRFILSDEQLQYLCNLDEDFRQDLANQIAYAINYQIPIVLDKQTDAKRTAELAGDGDSVKVTAYEASQKRQDSVEEEPPNPEAANETKWSPDNRDKQSADAALTIRIFYRTP